jgi:subtilase family serine protease
MFQPAGAMKKILTVSALAIAALMLAAPFATASDMSDINYQANPIVMQVTPAGMGVNGIPLCKSARLVNIVCYSPKFIRKAYDVPSSLDGSGQTIVIVDAFGSPTITTDLTNFDARFGISAPPSFTIFCGDSATPFDVSTCPNVPITSNTLHDVEGWAFETSLDVEYSHAIAPGANIVLDVAASSSGNAINAAESAAIAQYPGAVFSQSFGIPEIFLTANNGQVMQAEKNYVAGVAAGDTFFASAGDSGATFGFATPMANFPESDVHNTGVTGTQGLPYNATGTLEPCPTVTPFSCTSGLAAYHGPCVLGRTTLPDCIPDGYGGEQVWNEPSFGASTGGAQSLIIGVPSYQAGLGLTSRGPDVAYNAAIDGGVLVDTTFLGFRALFIVGGTSAGSPQWAGITALANQARASAGKGPIGDLNPVLYEIFHGTGPYNALSYGNDFHDITVGNDQQVGTPVGYSAGSGYDLASGIGSPIVANLVADLVLA